MHPLYLIAFILWFLLGIHHLLTFWTAHRRYVQGLCPRSIVVHLGLVCLFHIPLPFLVVGGSST